MWLNVITAADLQILILYSDAILQPSIKPANWISNFFLFLLIHSPTSVLLQSSHHIPACTLP